VEEKRLTQWFLKITDYAERLLNDLDPLPWREEIKDAQRAWIGKSEGAKLKFPIENRDEFIEVFTTRPDTIYGATYVVLAPEHPLVDILLESVSNRGEVEAYQKETRRKTERERSENKEKTGVCLKGIAAINPATLEPVPVYIADYALASYGTGAVMAVPAHDERDFAFAKVYSLPIKRVISEKGIDDGEELSEAYTGFGPLINSGPFSSLQNEDAKWDIVDAVAGERSTNYRIRDWLISRQRYWGCPIPVVYDLQGKAHPVAPEHLPWVLPSDVDFTPNSEGSPLRTSKELQERVTALYGEGWTPEYDTLDTFVDSSWYFYRYLDAQDENDFSDMGLMKTWLPVDMYSGGAEHTTMHLLYSRFFHKALHDLALVPHDEPFLERNNRGIILGTDGHKMSKSKGNVVNPDDMVQKYGADAVRMYLSFIGPYNEPGNYPWNLDGVFSMRRFLDRIHTVSTRVTDVEASPELSRALMKAVEKVGTDIGRMKYNTAISALMVCLKDFEALESVPRDAFREFVILLAPLAPHLAEHLFEALGGEGSVHQASWPIVNQELLSSETKTVIVQVSGKKRGEISLPDGASEADALALARELPTLKDLFSKGEPSRVIFVPNRILNLVFATP